MWWKACSAFVGVAAAAVGLLLSPIPSNLGLYRWLARKNPALDGLSRSLLNGPWSYTLEDLYRDNDPQNHRLRGQTAIVTGANSGVGYAKALALGRLGASVTLVCRNDTKCQEAARTIRDDARYGGGELTTATVDTASLRSVQTFCRDYLRSAHKGASLDMLLLNAGIGSAGVNADGSLPLSEDGIERVFATNYVGHHLMYRLLEPLLLKSKTSRIVHTSSSSSFGTFPGYKVSTSLQQLNSAEVTPDGLVLYGQSKLAQILWVKHLTKRLSSSTETNHVFANAYHPGAVDTGIWNKHPFIPQFLKDTLIKWMRHHTMWSPEEGALTGIYLAVEVDDLAQKNIRGKYFHPQTKEIFNPDAMDEELQEKLWKFSDELVSDFL